MAEFAPVTSFNRKAMIGFIISLLAIVSLCVGFLPIPLTALICYPSGFVMGIASLVLGSIALHELRTDGKNGQPFAWFAAWTGGLTVLTLLCLTTTGVLLYPRIAEFVLQIFHGSTP